MARYTCVAEGSFPALRSDVFLIIVVGIVHAFKWEIPHWDNPLLFISVLLRAWLYGVKICSNFVVTAIIRLPSHKDVSNPDSDSYFTEQLIFRTRSYCRALCDGSRYRQQDEDAIPFFVRIIYP